MSTAAPHNRIRFGSSGFEAPDDRLLPAEVAVALSYNGSTQAVMMASPADLEDFATGFTLTEGIADPAEIAEITVQETPLGIDLQIWLEAEAEARLSARRRSMAGPVGCGLCGIDSLEEATRRPPQVSADLRLTPDQVMAAIAGLPAHQPLHDRTRAVHAAGFFQPGQGIILAREDVGRHNALDKLGGALVRQGIARDAGAVVLTSRVSIDMVQKCARLGVPVLIAVSAPTTAALALAEEAGITVCALARPDRFELFTHPERIVVDA